MLDHPGPQDAEWRTRLARVARDMTSGHATRLADARQVSDLLERALANVQGDELAVQLCVLRAELATQGLTAAGTHVRINAVQLHNAIRKTIGMDHAPDDPTHRLTYVNAIARLIETTEPQTINFGSVTEEKATARRMFMTMVQMLKHLDGSEPIRFLIAECDTPFTLLTALYFARLFGIEERIDISPLFETRIALERGAEIIAGALAVPAYRDYLRKRGRVCIQTGFSDAGRYMGQPAACALIEKIRLGMAQVLAEHGLADLELTIFDTHGESIGRGAHPGSIQDRLRYYDTPESRRRFAAAGIQFRQESSFQGGDGYLYFLAPESALAVTTRILEHCLGPVEEADDPFYVQQDYVDEFFAAVEQFNKEVIENPCYASLLGAYGVNMLYPAGSRAMRRQYDGGGARLSIEHPSQLRAIPHNSILQQLGVLANTIGGVGEAVAKDPERFLQLYRESPRFRRLITMVEHAFKFTDLEVMKAYVDLFDPEPWLRRAAAAVEQGEQEELRTVADYLERIDLHDRLARIHRVFHRDYMDLARALREHRRLARDAGEQPIAVDAQTRDNLHMLHALRLGADPAADAAVGPRARLFRPPCHDPRQPDRAADASRRRAGAGAAGPDLPGDRGGRGGAGFRRARNLPQRRRPILPDRAPDHLPADRARLRAAAPDQQRRHLPCRRGGLGPRREPIEAVSHRPAARVVRVMTILLAATTGDTRARAVVGCPGSGPRSSVGSGRSGR